MPSAPGASIPAPGILTPANDASLNRSSRNPAPASSQGLAAKRSLIPPTDDLLKSTIVIKPHPSNLSVKPHVLSPLMLLPRESLPLSALDLCHSHGDFPSSRFYESHIKILELEGRLGSNVLLARSEASRAIYAIERNGEGLHTLCKLGAWVDVGKLGQHATVVCMQRIRACKPTENATAGSLPFTTPELHKENKKKRLAIEEIQSIIRKRSRSQSVATIDQFSREDCLSTQGTTTQGTKDSTTEEAQTRTTIHTDSQAVAEAGPELAGSQANPDVQQSADGADLSPPTAESIFENIRAQYFEVLYHSMGSLAYFAKGPLSRARAAFHLDCDSNLEMNDLIGFLRGLVMTTAVIDKKYRETVPEIISRLKTFIEDSEADDSKPKKRKTKKMKLGKDGLYPSEYSHIKRWWTVQKPQTLDDKPMSPQEARYHVSCLRRRETQLQMILILEILALEPLGQQSENSESQLPGTEPQTAAEEASSESIQKKRNRHNLPVLVDVHADRLCIWHSTTLDEMKALAESQTSSKAQATEQSDRPDSDPLKDFCVDVILPFFSARLPSICDSINRKLGGPVMKPTSKTSLSKTVVSAKPKPGAPMKRSASSRKDKDRALERVLSNERLRRSVSRGPTGAMALMRSASATAIPGLKREGSEPLMAMALAPQGEREKNPHKERPPHLFARSTSISSMEDLKAKQKASVDAELKEAISALKKPNRALAGKEIAEEAERRSLTGVSQLKKLKKPNRAPGLPVVQVKATPVNTRFKDVFAAEVDHHHNQAQLPRSQQTANASEEINHTPSSSLVPSSTAPRRSVNFFFGSSSEAADHSATSDKVQATPGTELSSEPPGFQGLEHAKGHGTIPSSSPILARKAAAPAARTKYLSVPGLSARQGGSSSDNNNDIDLLLPSSPGLPTLFETPLKPRSAMGSNDRTEEVIMSVTPTKSRFSQLIGNGKSSTKLDKVPPAQVNTDAGTTTALDREEKKEKTTIYQRLGWDDDDYDDLI